MNTTPVRLLIATSAAACLLALFAESASAAIVCTGTFAGAFTPAIPTRRPRPSSSILIIGGRRLQPLSFTSAGVRSSASPESTSFETMAASTIQNGSQVAHGNAMAPAAHKRWAGLMIGGGTTSAWSRRIPDLYPAPSVGSKRFPKRLATSAAILGFQFGPGSRSGPQ